MTLKTGVRSLWPWLPKNAEMAAAAALDEAPDVGRAQVEQWDPQIVDAMRIHGVVVDPEDSAGSSDGFIDATAVSQ
jgi:hypothetical protein